MALLWVALAIVLGVVAGDLLAARGLFGCGWPPWVWAALLPLLPLAALLRRWEREPEGALTWPREAGFRAPRTRPSPALVAACGVAAALGLARMAAQPLVPAGRPLTLPFTTNYRSAPSPRTRPAARSRAASPATYRLRAGSSA